jgi:Ran GTPase-activating protein (RanGAP) involved in mRNA processing and transport
LAGLTRFRHFRNWQSLTDHGESAAADLRSLGNSPHLASLRHLELHTCPVKPEGAAELASGANFANLDSLTLWSCGVTPEMLTTLGQAPFANQLTTLDLRCNFFGDAGTTTLAGLSFGRLSSLDLGFNSIAGEGLAALVSAPFLPGLKRLGLGHGHFSGASLAFLFERVRLDSLRILNLDGSKIRVIGPLAIAGTRSLPELRTLIFSNAELTSADAVALANARHLPNLHTLNLWANRITNEGVQALAGSTALPALRVLSLADNKGITDAGAKALADSSLVDRLVRLDLCGTSISAKGKKFLKDRFGDRVSLG